MSDLIANGSRDTPAPVETSCPNCGSDATVTSAFAAENAAELNRLSAWCQTCGYGFGADELEGSQ